MTELFCTEQWNREMFSQATYSLKRISLLHFLSFKNIGKTAWYGVAYKRRRMHCFIIFALSLSLSLSRSLPPSLSLLLSLSLSLSISQIEREREGEGFHHLSVYGRIFLKYISGFQSSCFIQSQISAALKVHTRFFIFLFFIYLFYKFGRRLCIFERMLMFQSTERFLHPRSAICSPRLTRHAYS